MQTKKVIFTSLHQAEKLRPFPNSAIISINDCYESEANLHSGWSNISRFYFIDSDYTEESIRHFGDNARLVYDHHFTKSQALTMIFQIHQFINSGVDTIVVHCYAGRSRSAAVAKFISETFGFLPYNNVDAYHQNTVNFNSPNPIQVVTDFSRMNSLVYTLLKTPGYYDAVWREVIPTTPEPSAGNLAKLSRALLSIFKNTPSKITE